MIRALLLPLCAVACGEELHALEPELTPQYQIEIYSENIPLDMVDNIARAAEDYFRAHDLKPLFGKFQIAMRDNQVVDYVCGQHNIACNNWHRILVRPSKPTRLCQAISHEMGHSIATVTHKSWDQLHVFLKDYYENYVFDSCERIMR